MNKKRKVKEGIEIFEKVFWHYKKDIRKKAFSTAAKENTWSDWCILGVFLLLVVGIVLTMILNFWELFILLIFVMIFSIPAINAYENWKLLNTRHSKLNEYLQQRMTPLADLLKQKDLNLYNHKSIDWLIERCDDFSGNKTERPPILSAFQSILPVITLVFGALLARMELQGLIIVVSCIFLLVLCVVLYLGMKDAFLGTDYRLARELKADLQYIRTLLPD